MALAKLSEIDVALEGVKGAKNFFEAKVGSFFPSRTIAPSLYSAQQEMPVSDSLNSLGTSLDRLCVIAGERMSACNLQIKNKTGKQSNGTCNSLWFQIGLLGQLPPYLPLTHLCVNK